MSGSIIHNIVSVKIETKDKVFAPKKSIVVRGNLIDFGSPLVMGIINATPDSFYEKSRIGTEKQALTTADKMLNDGADILDIGAASTRPGAGILTPGDEWKRLKNVLTGIRKAHPAAIISVDTYQSQVAQWAIEEGADIINDVSGGEMDTAMFELVGRHKIPYVLMHMRGTPETMTKLTAYNNLIEEIALYFSDKINQLKQAGVKDIIIDPGFGFSKTAGQSFELLNKLEFLQLFEVPVLAGLSRKSLIYKTLGINAEDALNGTTALNTIALMKGASVLRVHDVKEAKQCVILYSELVRQAGK